MPRSVLLTTCVLVVVAAVLGFVAGQRWQPLDETQVINRIAAQYITETGGKATDCLAVPGKVDVWIRVTCAGRSYYVDRHGKLMPRPGPST
jgi:hypothetical protein